MPLVIARLIRARVNGGLQLNFGGIGVELRMEERRIEQGIHVNPSGPPCCGGGRSGLLSINYSLPNLIFNYP